MRSLLVGRLGQGTTMFFLVRVAFWLGLVCVLLPGSGSKSGPELSSVDTLKAVSAAGATVADMRNFCDRQAEACAVGGQVAEVLGHRAQEGAKTIVEFISQQMADQATGSARKSETHKATAQNTLSTTDILPAWNGPANSRAPEVSAPATVPLPPVRPRREASAGRPAA